MFAKLKEMLKKQVQKYSGLSEYRNPKQGRKRKQMATRGMKQSASRGKQKIHKNLSNQQLTEDQINLLLGKVLKFIPTPITAKHDQIRRQTLRGYEQFARKERMCLPQVKIQGGIPPIPSGIPDVSQVGSHLF